MSKKTTESYRFDFIDFSKNTTSLLEDKRVVLNQALYNVTMDRLIKKLNEAMRRRLIYGKTLR